LDPEIDKRRYSEGKGKANLDTIKIEKIMLFFIDL